MHCTNCGTYIAAGQRFCAGCGAPASDPEATRYAGAPPPQPYPHQPYQPQPYVAPPPPQPTPAAYATPAPRYERTSDAEQEIFKVRPTLFFIKVGYGLAALGAIILVILLAYTPLPTWLSVLLGLALLLVPAYYHVKRNMVEYKLTNHKIEIDEGFIARTTRNLPLRNIQDVTVSSSIFQRVLGYGNVVIDNASELGGSTVLRNIHNPRKYADLLLRELRRFH
ncbi:MAG TPA: PH domain-containing protein [Pyrinomonadaceae bacterium]|nr:PH domain-containing protein [Pyrinomonadaceae bacterium]